ncbi:hypothetical protein RN22_03360 [Grimontia sp. AD028]|uniref:hypothetical protein n=1 Tax=Grimontia sp. AD028 TaxID=1581149 RepID=UPI00061B1D5A|nr:hypothetical protein [Grimontia sp. AD028]KKD61953.1 hypothetical protein RN22_03360 [Grimontia sp. AD028]
MRQLAIAALIATLPIAVHAGNGKGNGETPNGQPFQHLQSQISDLQSQIDTLVGRVDSLEGHISAVEGAISTLQTQNSDLQTQINSTNDDVSDLQDQIDQNSLLIAALEAQQAQLEQSLEMKQNVIDGNCPDGSAIQAVNEDGSVVCATTGGQTGTGFSGGIEDLDRVIAYGWGYSYAQATCPEGFSLTGGGFYNSNYYYYYNNVNASYPWHNTWYVSASNYYYYYYNYVYSYAMCVRGTGTINWQYVYN